MNINANKYDLVMKKDRGNYMPINISLLGFSYESLNDIRSIDMFTSKYSKEQLLNAIKNANIIPTEFLLSGELKIAMLDSNKHKYIVDFPVLTNDYLNGFNLENYLGNNLKDKAIINTIRNKYKDILESKTDINIKDDIFVDFSKVKENNVAKNNINKKLLEFDEAKNNNDVNKLIKLIFDLDYIDSRKLCSYIIENICEINKQKELLREKAA
jgi:hypothetical protein